MVVPVVERRRPAPADPPWSSRSAGAAAPERDEPWSSRSPNGSPPAPAAPLGEAAWSSRAGGGGASAVDADRRDLAGGRGAVVADRPRTGPARPPAAGDGWDDVPAQQGAASGWTPEPEPDPAPAPAAAAVERWDGSTRRAAADDDGWEPATTGGGDTDPPAAAPVPWRPPWEAQPAPPAAPAAPWRPETRHTRAAAERPAAVDDDDPTPPPGTLAWSAPGAPARDDVAPWAAPPPGEVRAPAPRDPQWEPSPGPEARRAPLDDDDPAWAPPAPGPRAPPRTAPACSRPRRRPAAPARRAEGTGVLPASAPTTRTPRADATSALPVQEPTSRAAATTALPAQEAGTRRRRAAAADPTIPSGKGPRPLVALAVLVVVWADAVVVGGQLNPPRLVFQAAVLVHLASLAVGLGGVVAIDAVGLRWLRGRRPLGDVLRVGADVELPIWLGYAGLLVSGALLAPDLSQPLMWVKLLLVLGIGVGGLNAYRLRRAAATYPALLTRADAPPGLVRRAAVAAVVSQLCWWGALLTGVLVRFSPN